VVALVLGAFLTLGVGCTKREELLTNGTGLLRVDTQSADGGDQALWVFSRCGLPGWRPTYMDLALYELSGEQVIKPPLCTVRHVDTPEGQWRFGSGMVRRDGSDCLLSRGTYNVSGAGSGCVMGQVITVLDDGGIELGASACDRR
jgi:hypothetical protein